MMTSMESLGAEHESFNEEEAINLLGKEVLSTRRFAMVPQGTSCKIYNAKERKGGGFDIIVEVPAPPPNDFELLQVDKKQFNRFFRVNRQP